MNGVGAAVFGTTTRREYLSNLSLAVIFSEDGVLLPTLSKKVQLRLLRRNLSLVLRDGDTISVLHVDSKKLLISKEVISLETLRAPAGLSGTHPEGFVVRVRKYDAKGRLRLTKYNLDRMMEEGCVVLLHVENKQEIPFRKFEAPEVDL